MSPAQTKATAEDFQTKQYRRSKTLAEMFDVSGDCWDWKGSVISGYGAYRINYRYHRAHRVVWEALVGPIPEDMVIDHLCRNKLCVNPDHLEVVTWAENLRRGHHSNQNKVKKVCKRGHEFDYVTPDGRRKCKTCQRASNARYLARKKV